MILFLDFINNKLLFSKISSNQKSFSVLSKMPISAIGDI